MNPMRLPEFNIGDIIRYRDVPTDYTRELYLVKNVYERLGRYDEYCLYKISTGDIYTISTYSVDGRYEKVV